jgi:hypothetical protein
MDARAIRTLSDAMTKDQASDLQSLITRQMQTAETLFKAKVDYGEAERQLLNFVNGLVVKPVKE